MLSPLILSLFILYFNSGSETYNNVTAQLCGNPSKSSPGYRYRVNQLKTLAAIGHNIPQGSQYQLTAFINLRLRHLEKDSKHNMDDAKLMGELEDLLDIKNSLKDAGAPNQLIDKLIGDKFTALFRFSQRLHH
ncbi:MAG: hypothetical protein Q9216_007069, partial [Gyalolechia sp. 2 TL-2023]